VFSDRLLVPPGAILQPVARLLGRQLIQAVIWTRLVQSGADPQGGSLILVW
jgi:hypothetical protein